MVQAVCVACGGAYAVTAKEDDRFKNAAIIHRFNRLCQDRTLDGDGEQQPRQNDFKGTSGNCLSALDWWFGFGIWSDRIHKPHSGLKESSALPHWAAMRTKNFGAVSGLVPLRVTCTVWTLLVVAVTV